MMIIAYWARKNPDGIVRFMFGLQFKAAYLPWVMLAFEILLGALFLACKSIINSH